VERSGELRHRTEAGVASACEETPRRIGRSKKPMNIRSVLTFIRWITPNTERGGTLLPSASLTERKSITGFQLSQEAEASNSFSHEFNGWRSLTE
jgi:hypothetical protein